MNLVRVQDLADKAARVHARDWFDRFAKAYVGDAVARDNARDQLESHLIEALESDPQASVQRVDEALARLGVPEEIAAEWSEAPLEAPSGGVRRKVVRFAASLARGASGILAMLMLAAALARMSDPQSVGVFRLSDGVWLLGTANNQNVEQDVLGAWTIPVALALALALMVGARAGLGLWSAIMSWRKKRGVSPSS